MSNEFPSEKEAIEEATKKAHMEEYANLSVIYGQLEAGNVEDSLKMMEARLQLLHDKYFNGTN